MRPILLLCSALLLLVAVSASGQQRKDKENDGLDRWLEKDVDSTRYDRVEPKMREIFDQAQENGVPERLLLDKLTEGARRNVAPGTLLEALELELASGRIAAELIDGLDTRRLGAEERSSLIFDTSVYVRGGVTPRAIRAYFDASSVSGRKWVDLFRCAAAVLAIHSVTPLDEEEQLGLGVDLLSGRSPSRYYGSVSSFFAKAAVSGMAKDEILDLMRSILREGGGLVQMERELEQRSKR